MMDYIDCWISSAHALFARAITEEVELKELSRGRQEAGGYGFAATLKGCRTGRFTVILDPAMFLLPLMGDGADQKLGWGQLLREVASAAAGELLVRTGEACEVAEFVEAASIAQASRAFQLRLSESEWTVLVIDEVVGPASEVMKEPGSPGIPDDVPHPVALSSGVELLLDVELEAAIRFGCREMSLCEVLELGPGDVVELDRQVVDPVDLIVGDKIVARGEVVLVDGNFGLRVTEVALPRKRLESIRCLF